jgi:hypothetical protein
MHNFRYINLSDIHCVLLPFTLESHSLSSCIRSPSQHYSCHHRGQIQDDKSNIDSESLKSGRVTNNIRISSCWSLIQFLWHEHQTQNAYLQEIIGCHYEMEKINTSTYVYFSPYAILLNTKKITFIAFHVLRKTISTENSGVNSVRLWPPCLCSWWQRMIRSVQ